MLLSNEQASPDHLMHKKLPFFEYRSKKYGQSKLDLNSENPCENTHSHTNVVVHIGHDIC